MAQVPQVSQFAPVTQVQHVAAVPQIAHTSPVYYHHAAASAVAPPIEHHQTFVKPYPVYIKEEPQPLHTVVEHHPSLESSYWNDPEPIAYHKPHTYAYPSHAGMCSLLCYRICSYAVSSYI